MHFHAGLAQRQAGKTPANPLFLVMSEYGDDDVWGDACGLGFQQGQRGGERFIRIRRIFRGGAFHKGIVAGQMGHQPQNIFQRRMAQGHHGGQPQANPAPTAPRNSGKAIWRRPGPEEVNASQRRKRGGAGQRALGIDHQQLADIKADQPA
jgi:hypothetical protein